MNFLEQLNSLLSDFKVHSLSLEGKNTICLVDNDEKDYLKRCGMIDDLYLWKNDKWYVASKKRFVELISFLTEFE